MAKESGTNALTDAGIDYGKVEAAYVGYCAGSPPPASGRCMSSA